MKKILLGLSIVLFYSNIIYAQGLGTLRDDTKVPLSGTSQDLDMGNYGVRAGTFTGLIQLPDGTSISSNPFSSGGITSSSTARIPTIYICSYDSQEELRNEAKYVCGTSSAEIQILQVLSELNAKTPSGGTILFEHGSYHIHEFNYMWISSNTHLIGNGEVRFYLDYNDSSAEGCFYLREGAENVTFENLSFISRTNNATTADSFVIGTKYSSPTKGIENIRVKDCKFYDIKTSLWNNGSSLGSTAPMNRNLWFENNKSYYSSNLYAHQPNDCFNIVCAQNVIFTNNILNGGADFSYVKDLIISDNIVVSTYTLQFQNLLGFVVNYTSNVIVANNEANKLYYGFTIYNSRNIQILGNQSNGCGFYDASVTNVMNSKSIGNSWDTDPLFINGSNANTDIDVNGYRITAGTFTGVFNLKDGTSISSNPFTTPYDDSALWNAVTVSSDTEATRAKAVETEIMEATGTIKGLLDTETTNRQTADNNIWLSTPSFGQQITSSTARIPTVYVCASNSPEELRNEAKYVCTGTNDDIIISSAIQNQPQGTSFLLEVGTFVVNNTCLITQNGTILKGQGKNLTFIKVKNSAALSNSGIFTADDGVCDVVIKDITFDGNKDNNTNTIYGIHAPNDSSVHKNWIVDNCTFRNFKKDGINIWNFNDSTIKYCFFSDLGVVAAEGLGIQLLTSTANVMSHGNVLFHNYFENCGNGTLYAENQDSFYIDYNHTRDCTQAQYYFLSCGTGSITHNMITNQHGNGSVGAAIRIRDSVNIDISNNIIIRCNYGINEYPGGSYSMKNSRVNENTITGVNYSGIDLNLTNSIVSDNVVMGNLASADCDTGIKITSNHNTVSNNNVSDFTNYGYDLNGTSYTVIGNKALTCGVALATLSVSQLVNIGNSWNYESAMGYFIFQTTTTQAGYQGGFIAPSSMTLVDVRANIDNTQTDGDIVLNIQEYRTDDNVLLGSFKIPTGSIDSGVVLSTYSVAQDSGLKFYVISNSGTVANSNVSFSVRAWKPKEQ